MYTKVLDGTVYFCPLFCGFIKLMNKLKNLVKRSFCAGSLGVIHAPQFINVFVLLVIVDFSVYFGMLCFWTILWSGTCVPEDNDAFRVRLIQLIVVLLFFDDFCNRAILGAIGEVSEDVLPRRFLERRSRPYNAHTS